MEKYETLCNGVHFTACCDAERRVLPIHTFGRGYKQQCKECGEKYPDTYTVEKSIEDLIEGDTAD